jgi:hypothetical protein
MVHSIQCDRLGQALVGIERFAEEGLGSGYFAPVNLVNAPRLAHCKGMAAQALLELGAIVPDPSHNGCMCKRQATLRHHLDPVAQAQFEPKVPAHALK